MKFQRGSPMLGSLESVGGRIDGAPIWRALETPQACPNCGCAVVEVQVRVIANMLKGGAGVGRYNGCPACPWADVMFIEADGMAKKPTSPTDVH